MTISNSYFWLNKSKSRFYAITVIKDNPDNILMNYKWGSCSTNRGGKKKIIVNSEEELQNSILKMLKRRNNRGYELIMPISS